MAEVHRPGADHAHDDQAERFQPALAQIDMRTQCLLEGGDGTVRHRAILWRESARKSPHTALSYPSVVQCGRTRATMVKHLISCHFVSRVNLLFI